MKDFPSCFGENAVQVSDSSSSNSNKTAQNLVICVYQCSIQGRSCLITITWSKSLMGQGFSVGIDDSSNQCLCKVDVKPWGVFSKRKGGIVVDKQMVLLLGDLRKEAFKKSNAVPLLPSNAVFVAKKEHVFGKKFFGNKVVFCDNGQIHDLVIECDTSNASDPCLIIRVDSKIVMQVKRLKWKFRGNYTILVDGIPVEVYWDVYNWLFGTSFGNAVFMFRTCSSQDKIWASQPISDANVLQWSFSQRFSETKLQQGVGFSHVLYAWKNE
ncbi:uncharacterized protein [Cicer arietinum]|uniref:uncharacterized protein isoform X3 n=1 Tax=Cicer arietinum TaxID=3827 RepID=UPI003CC55375